MWIVSSLPRGALTDYRAFAEFLTCLVLNGW